MVAKEITRKATNEGTCHKAFVTEVLCPSGRDGKFVTATICHADANRPPATMSAPVAPTFAPGVEVTILATRRGAQPRRADKRL